MNGTRRIRSRGQDGRFAKISIMDGHVSCPRRGPVDIVECFMCPLSGGLSPEHAERLLCAWSPFSPAAQTR